MSAVAVLGSSLRFFYKDLGLKNLFLQKENPFFNKKMELFKTYNATYLGFGKNARCADCLLTR